MIENEYRHNRRFREYVDQYCSEHGMTVKEALEDARIRQACRWFTEV